MKNYILPTILFTSSLLSVTPIVANATHLKHGQSHPGDAAITLNIKAKYTADSLLNPFKISVTTNHGVVALSGQVNSKTEYEKAVSLAESTDGVNDVETKALTVKDSRTPLDDVAITAKIKGKLLQDKLFSDKEMAYWGFTVETHDHVVYLSGKVDSSAIKDNIGRVAAATKGVHSVKNTLEVTG